MAKGGFRPGAGRKPNSVNSDKLAFLEKLAELDCDPVERLAQFCMDKVPCTKCNPKSHMVTQVQYLVWAECDDAAVMMAAKRIREKITCPWCAGTGTKIIESTEVLMAARELISRMHAKLAAKKVEKTVKRVRLSRMNAVSEERREELERVAEDADEDDTIH